MKRDRDAAEPYLKTRKARQYYRFIRQLSKGVHKYKFGDAALDMAVEQHHTRPGTYELDPKLHQLLQNIAKMWCNSPSPLQKKRTLSVVVNQVPYRVLVRYIPNC